MIRTLIVEDDPAVARMHQRALERLPGFVVVGTVDTGAAALDRLLDGGIDLVLLDIHLPDFSGVEVLHRLRRLSDEAVDVIVVSSANDGITVSQAASARIADYLVKPFSRAVFEQKLGSYRDAGRSPRERIDPAPLGQEDVNALVEAGRIPDRRLPKGLSASTARLVESAVPVEQAASASEVASTCGLSRITARRYLDHLVRTGNLQSEHRYGQRGRPEILYRRR
ncbi:response regulator [Mycetocola tolaasinivorans]|uniref:Transcriptional regulatory protein n=1 Tax=Mycetocola tolaasinivorans TaxID=76635 RepID=A0A3L7ACT9_9MICO|nr:response regulator [Mycetocola tolaasinivorans]RLP77794.1 response regulator [Mycetocola tolaasinivorans]